MNTLPIDLYKVIEYGLGGDTWQEFIDRYKEKYDLLQIDGFEFEATKLDYTFSQLITSLGVKTLPAYVEPFEPCDCETTIAAVATGRHVRIDGRDAECVLGLA